MARTFPSHEYEDTPLSPISSLLDTWERVDGAGNGKDWQTPASHTSAVLVHGAWEDGSSWSKVIGPLEAEGINVVAAPLPLTFPGRRRRSR
jgi:hypothetical protein